MKPSHNAFLLRLARSLLLAAIVLSSLGLAALKPASASSGVPSQSRWNVTWSAKAYGASERVTDTGTKININLLATMSGSGVVTYDIQYDQVFGTFYNGSYRLDSRLTNVHTINPKNCEDSIFNYDRRFESNATTSHTYTGTYEWPDPMFVPEEAGPGNWIIPGFDVTVFFINKDDEVQESTQISRILCRGSTPDEYLQGLSHARSYFGRPGDLTLDPATGVYAYSGDVTVPYPSDDPINPLEGPMTVHWEVSARPACGTGGPVVDGKDPLTNWMDITLQDGQPIRYDETTQLEIEVTCEGVPVKNADLKISVVPIQNSAGHWHGGPERPRGYLDGVKITESTPEIQRSTGANGKYSLKFGPGKDKKNDAIGISGLYEITVQSLRYPGSTARTIVDVGLDTLTLVTNNDLIVTTGQKAQHLVNTWATPVTKFRLQGIAANWRESLAQLGPSDFPECGLLWPLVWPPRLEVNDISLQKGGLFDVIGWDNQAGQLRGAPWQPPHYTHLDGTVVDFTFRDALPCMRDRLKAELIAVTRGSGAWAGGPTLTFNVAQTAGASLQAETSAGPDLGAINFLSREIPGAAAGQVVDYVIGADNALGSAPANNVSLTAFLPAGLSFESANPAPSQVISPNQLAWNLGTLPAQSGPHLVRLKLKVNPGTPTGSKLVLNASVSASETDANPADNTFDSTPLQVQITGGDLFVQTSLMDEALVVNRPLTVTLQATNLGNTPAPDSYLIFGLPPSVTLTSSAPFTPTLTNMGWRWDLGDLPVDEVKTITVTLELDPRLAAAIPENPGKDRGTELEFRLDAHQSGLDVNIHDNTLIFKKPPAQESSDLLAWIEALPTDSRKPAAGQERSYYLKWANLGMLSAPGTRLQLQLSPGLTLVSVDPAGSAADLPYGTHVITWELNDLVPGATGEALVKIRLDSIPPGGAQMAVSITGQSADLTPFNNSDLEFFRQASQSPGGGTGYKVFLPFTAND